MTDFSKLFPVGSLIVFSMELRDNGATGNVGKVLTSEIGEISINWSYIPREDKGIGGCYFYREAWDYMFLVLWKPNALQKIVYADRLGDKP